MKKGRSTKKKYFGMEKNKAIILGMAFIILISMAGGIASSLIEEDETPEEELFQASVAIDFGNFSRLNKIVNFKDSQTAHDLFNELGTLTLDFVGSSFIVTAVETGNQSATGEGDFMWVFYVNGIINFDSPDTYLVRHGDMLELRFEENPY